MLGGGSRGLRKSGLCMTRRVKCVGALTIRKSLDSQGNMWKFLSAERRISVDPCTALQKAMLKLAAATGAIGPALSCLDEPRGVAGYLVDLNVNALARLAFAPGCHRQRVGDQENLEGVALDSVNGERGPVQRDRTLDRDELGQLSRGAKREMGHAVEIASRQNFRRSVNMAADHVAPELVADFERALKIDAATPSPMGKRGDRERLGPHVESDGRTAAIGLNADDRQASARLAIDAPRAMDAAS